MARGRDPEAPPPGPEARAMIAALIEELRPWQWTKNLLLFAGVLFSLQLGHPQLVLRAAAGFVAFSLLSGAVYLLNDLADLAADRRHPSKRHRPIASGRLPAATAWMALGPLLGAVLAISLWLGAGFSIVAWSYFGLNLAYSFGLKHQVLIDVFIIAIGFVMRAIAGVELLQPVSPAPSCRPGCWCARSSARCSWGWRSAVARSRTRRATPRCNGTCSSTTRRRCSTACCSSRRPRA